MLVRRFAGAMLGSALGLLPVIAVGALATLIRRDLHFSEAELGVAIAAFFTASAVFSVAAGAFSERRGASTSARWAVALGTFALLGMAVAAKSWAWLLPWLVVGGAANALAQTSTNGLVADVIPATRNGLGFGVKQSAGPVSTLVVGLSIPAVGLTVGWRWTLVGAALLSLPALLALRGPGVAARANGRTRAILHGRRAPLVLVAVGTALGAGAVNCLQAFYVESAVSDGLDLGVAGVFLAVGSLTGIAVRVAGGWWSDLARLPRLTIGALFLSTGAVAFLGLATLDTAALLPITVVLFGASWGWNGLVLAAAVDAHPEAPAEATSITQAGLYAGAVVTPLAFGFVAEHAGYQAAWSMAGVSVALAAVLLFASRSRLAAPDQTSLRATGPPPDPGS